MRVPGGRELLNSGASPWIRWSHRGGGGNHADLPRDVLRAMQRQLELVQELIERERGLQSEVAARLPSRPSTRRSICSRGRGATPAQAGRGTGGGGSSAGGDRGADEESGRAVRAYGRHAAPAGKLAKGALGAQRRSKKRDPRTAPDCLSGAAVPRSPLSVAGHGAPSSPNANACAESTRRLMSMRQGGA